MNFSGISSRSMLGRVLRMPLRLIPDGLVVPILQGPLRGKRWITGASTHGCWLGSYEYDKQRSFAQMVSGGAVVYDVGAHVGYYTLLAADLVGSTGRVIAFEPLARNLAYLKRHLSLNAYPNVTLIEAAVAEQSGARAFEAPLGHHSEGHLAAGGRLQVPVVTLDELARDALPIPHLIKMDIEGGEYAALMGAKQLLAAYHPVILLATHGAEIHRQCCELLVGIGYQLSSLDGRAVRETDEIVAA